ncbi:two-component system response regulator YehT [Vibrio sp. UCD-FRSSP16_10]|uniref:two-component system response regulator BtsR n=1 Tax=unclassified Vibrio TaxID=2614977 RepID=UPI0007FBDCA5|nr:MULTISPECIES: two-component system response regulator BtsR [unclassified Vibrio]OBT07286.1 two-component system response regulator YehT [Vibrio sp. UCD-FRSSP16_30]OBT12766.1 two-component system response regulator YehT [Vibrio sp. UCD-FRSSP16_10]
MLRALVVDDELFAREELSELLEQTLHIEVIDQASNAIQALQKINTLKPDVVFLDIHMPQVSGIELLSMLDPDTMPAVVFVTAYDKYALQAFEDNAFDYLLKPIDPQRLNKTVCRLKKLFNKDKINVDYAAITPNNLEQVPCCGHNRIMLIPVDSIEVAYSDFSGVNIQTSEHTTSSQLTLKVLEEKTPLIRCHRQYLVSPKAIREIRLLDQGLAEIITLNGHQAPVSRRYLKVLKEKLGFS